MKIKYLIFIFIFFYFSCAHKDIKNDIDKIIEKPLVENDTTDDIELLYKRLIDSIINKKLDQIVSCYTEDAVFQYSDKVEKNITCFDGSKKVIGIENIKKNYEYLFRKRYLNIIEYEIVKIYKHTTPPKIIFINLWLNVEYDFYEIIECTIIDKKYYITNHTVVKGSEIRAEIER